MEGANVLAAIIPFFSLLVGAGITALFGVFKKDNIKVLQAAIEKGWKIDPPSYRDARYYINLSCV